jgi:hypothetical protein
MQHLKVLLIQTFSAVSEMGEQFRHLNASFFEHSQKAGLGSQPAVTQIEERIIDHG